MTLGPVADIPEIPESIKFCKALEIADFSGNPLSRCAVVGRVGVGCGGPRAQSQGPVRTSEARPPPGAGSPRASLSCAAWPTWP